MISEWLKNGLMKSKPVNMCEQAEPDRFICQDEKQSHIYHDSLLYRCPWLCLGRNWGEKEKNGIYWSGLNICIIDNNANCIVAFLNNLDTMHVNFLISLLLWRIQFWKVNKIIAMLYKKHSDPWLVITALS